MYGLSMKDRDSTISSLTCQDKGILSAVPLGKNFWQAQLSLPTPCFQRLFFLVCSCAKWKNCILNGLWVERQTGRFEGLACRVSSGICVSTGSGSSFCMPGEENNNDSGHNHFYTVMACINVGRGLDSQEWQQNSHTRPKIYSRQGSSK